MGVVNESSAPPPNPLSERLDVRKGSGARAPPALTASAVPTPRFSRAVPAALGGRRHQGGAHLRFSHCRCQRAAREMRALCRGMHAGRPLVFPHAASLQAWIALPPKPPWSMPAFLVRTRPEPVPPAVWPRTCRQRRHAASSGVPTRPQSHRNWAPRICVASAWALLASVLSHLAATVASADSAATLRCVLTAAARFAVNPRDVCCASSILEVSCGLLV